jgi:hypothetical protein
MKRLIVSVLIIVIISMIPYFIGRQQMNNAEMVIQNFMDNDSDTFEGTDGDIEDVLRVFNFNLSWDEHPSFIDYYKAGLAAL